MRMTKTCTAQRHFLETILREQLREPTEVAYMNFLGSRNMSLLKVLTEREDVFLLYKAMQPHQPQKLSSKNLSPTPLDQGQQQQQQDNNLSPSQDENDSNESDEDDYRWFSNSSLSGDDSDDSASDHEDMEQVLYPCLEGSESFFLQPPPPSSSENETDSEASGVTRRICWGRWNWPLVGNLQPECNQRDLGIIILPLIETVNSICGTRRRYCPYCNYSADATDWKCVDSLYDHIVCSHVYCEHLRIPQDLHLDPPRKARSLTKAHPDHISVCYINLIGSTTGSRRLKCPIPRCTYVTKDWWKDKDWQKVEDRILRHIMRRHTAVRIYQYKDNKNYAAFERKIQFRH
jgi:hypothetical protein